MMKGLLAPQQAGPGAHPPRGENILLVEPDEELREDMRLQLKLAGYEVATAEDAVVAGHRVLHRPPDLIVLRDRMPYMSGEEFVAALDGDPNLPRIPVIILTAPMPRDVLLETVARELALRSAALA